jgi:hypothetical protein
VDAANTDVYRTVEFGRERYWMKRVPLALLGCIAGLFMIAMDPGPPGLAPLVVLALLLLLGAAYGISTVALWHAFDSPLKAVRSVGFFLALALGVAVFFSVPPRYQRTSMIDMAFGTLGWIFLFFSLGYIAFALFKHVRPEKPMLSLSPTGLVLNISWLKDLRIPWYEVEHVGLLEHILPGGIVSRHPNDPVVVVSQEFYERHILPRRTFLSGNQWSRIFQPKGAQVQMQLPWPWFSIAMQDVAEPIDARWKAFREQPDAQAPATTAPPLRPSAWSPATLTQWQKIFLCVPTAGVLLMLAHFGGLWDSAFLKSARQDSAMTRQKGEEARRESQRYREQYRPVIEDGEKRQREYEERSRR